MSDDDLMYEFERLKMNPIPWQQILAVKVDQNGLLSADPQKHRVEVEKMYDLDKDMVNWNIHSTDQQAKNVGNLVHLFKVMQLTVE